MEYEICYLIGESKEINLDKIRMEVEKIIKKHQGKLLDGEFIKKRRLSYQIKKEARGTYVAKRFVLPDKDEREKKFSGIDFIGEMTVDLNFNQNVLRFVIVKTDDLPSLAEAIKREEKRIQENKNNRENNNDKKSEKRYTFKKQEERKPLDKKDTEVVEKKEVPKEKVEKVKKTAKKDVVKKDVEKVEKEKTEKDAEIKANKKVEKISEQDIDDKLDEILNI